MAIIFLERSCYTYTTKSALVPKRPSVMAIVICMFGVHYGQTFCAHLVACMSLPVPQTSPLVQHTSGLMHADVVVHLSSWNRIVEWFDSSNGSSTINYRKLKSPCIQFTRVGVLMLANNGAYCIDKFGKKKISVTAETRAGLSLVQHGYWHHAQSLSYQANVKASQKTYKNTMPKAEMYLWEEQWLYCASQLCQWDALANFGKSIKKLDSLWIVPGWMYMKEHVIPKAQVKETPKLRLIQAHFDLHEENTNSAGGGGGYKEYAYYILVYLLLVLFKIAYHTCVALWQCFKAHLLVLMDSICPSKSNRSAARNIPSVGVVTGHFQIGHAKNVEILPI
ncbi:hypothetical protein VNO77_02928 [Canavalia gladiata]|uniref:Uncharacterized protein n=1 Tax=Canavalia gladiata TaxID=3824 RepID=A0AAN9MTU7_CANGL